MATLTLSVVSVSQDSAEITGSYNCGNNEEKTSISFISPSTATCEIDEYGFNKFTATVTDLTPGSKETIKISLNYNKYVNKGTEYYFFYTDGQGNEGEESGDVFSMCQSYRDFKIDGYTLFPSSSGNAQYTTKYDGINIYLYKRDIVNETPDSITDSIAIYTKPNDFYFNLEGSLNNAGTISWNVSEGIQTVLPGLYDSINKKSPFNIEATKWKKWKEQTEDDIQDCLAFSAGDLSATMVNNAYKYLGASNEAIYKPGDFVSKQIFAGLEEIMNK